MFLSVKNISLILAQLADTGGLLLRVADWGGHTKYSLQVKTFRGENSLKSVIVQNSLQCLALYFFIPILFSDTE